MNGSNLLETLQAFLILVWGFDGVKLICIGVLLNVVLAVAAALQNGRFSFAVLGEFLLRKLLPYVMVYVVFKLVAGETEFAWVSVAVWALIQGMIVSSIVEKLADLGVPIPAGVLRVMVRPQRIIELRRIDVPGSGPLAAREASGMEGIRPL
jgi:hypothetical protein